MTYLERIHDAPKESAEAEDDLCEWNTPDGPCPNLSVGTVQIKMSRRDNDEVILDTGERLTCEWHLAQMIRDPVNPPV